MKGTRMSNVYQQIQTELNELEKETVQIDGTHMKPSQCYRFSLKPVHLLFNTNCPDSLRQKVLAIFEKYNLKEEV